MTKNINSKKKWHPSRFEIKFNIKKYEEIENKYKILISKNKKDLNKY